MKYFLIAAALFFSVTTLAQTSVTTLRFEFYIKNTDGAKIVICKLFDKTDLLTNDTIAFIKMQFRDDDKSGNNGYIILSGQKEVDDFAGCLTTALNKYSIPETYESPSGKFRIEVKNVTEFKKNTYRLYVCETLGGNARISLLQREATALLNWLESVTM
jgi:hypothetical protein